MLSQNELYNKLQFAKEQYKEYSLRLVDKYSEGNITKKVPTKLSVIQNWLEYLSSRISLISKLNAKDPNPVTLSNFSISSVYANSSISDSSLPYPRYEVLYIKDIHSKNIPISKFTVYTNDTIDSLVTKIVSGSLYVGTSQYQKSQIKLTKITNQGSEPHVRVSFTSVGGNFNNTTVRAASNLITFNTVNIKKGVSPRHIGFSLNNDNIDKYNTILEQIAVDLKFTYRDIDKDYSAYLFSSGNKKSTNITTADGNSITDENNNTLKFE